MKTWILQDQHLKQVKIKISLFLFHHLFPLEYLFTYGISLMQWEINFQAIISTRVTQKNIKSLCKPHCKKTILRKHFQNGTCNLGSSLFYNTSARYKWHECDTNDMSATRVKHERHECDTSTTRTTWVRHESEILILITTQVKTYFHTPILATWQMKDYKKRNSFILKTTVWKCLVPMPKCI